MFQLFKYTVIAEIQHSGQSINWWTLLQMVFYNELYSNRLVLSVIAQVHTSIHNWLQHLYLKLHAISNVLFHINLKYIQLDHIVRLEYKIILSILNKLSTMFHHWYTMCRAIHISQFTISITKNMICLTNLI